VKQLTVTNSADDPGVLTLADILHDKLKLLNYEPVCRRAGTLPPPAIAFALPYGSPSAQFALFARLAAWLCTEAGTDIKIDPYDPPATIADALRRAVADSGGDASTLDPVRLARPYGHAPCEALNALADAALVRRAFVFVPPERVADAAAAVESAPDPAGSDEEAVAAEVDSDSDIPLGGSAGMGSRPLTAAGFLRPSTVGSFGSSSRRDGSRQSLEGFSPVPSHRVSGLMTSSSPHMLPEILSGLEGPLAAEWRAETARVAPRLAQEAHLGTSLAAMPLLVPALSAASASAAVAASAAAAAASDVTPAMWRLRADALSHGFKAGEAALDGLADGLVRLRRDLGDAVASVQGRERVLGAQLGDYVRRHPVMSEAV
jgi:hypothetical protein